MPDDLMLPDAERDAAVDAEPISVEEAAVLSPELAEDFATSTVLDFQVVDGVPTSLAAYLDSLERDAIRCALAKTRYNRTAAAQLLGITFRQLRYRMQRLGIK
jgi:two-component system response regulator PilR (NtrC family)